MLTLLSASVDLVEPPASQCRRCICASLQVFSLHLQDPPIWQAEHGDSSLGCSQAIFFCYVLALFIQVQRGKPGATWASFRTKSRHGQQGLSVVGISPPTSHFYIYSSDRHNRLPIHRLCSPNEYVYHEIMQIIQIMEQPRN